MNYRNSKFNAFGTIDCEIEHPIYGWIPFTASPDDTEEHGREIFTAAQSIAESYVEQQLDSDEILNRQLILVKNARQRDFQLEADPLFFKWQAGEATEEEWKAKREEIRTRHPYPV